MGVALVSHGCIISSGRVVRSVPSSGVRINSYSEVEDSIVFDNGNVGRHCRIRRAIIEANLDVPENATIGVDLERDRQAGHFVTNSDIVVVHRDSPGIQARRRSTAEEGRKRLMKAGN